MISLSIWTIFGSPKYVRPIRIQQCISIYRKCDGGAECKDGSDESEALCTPPCSVDMFACADGLRCIPKGGICDPIGFIIVMMHQMNLSPSALLHVQLTCLLVLMD